MDIDVPKLINRIKNAKLGQTFKTDNERLTFTRAFATRVGVRDTLPTRLKLLKNLPKVKRILPGTMLFYHYNPKYKDTLPQWDAFPLVIVLDIYDDGFLGLNLHFVPSVARQKIFLAFLDVLKTSGKDEKRRILLDYSIAKTVVATKYFGPMIKRYLYSQFMVPPKLVPYDMWEDVLFLPLGEMHRNG
jgi:hypothetical protein